MFYSNENLWKNLLNYSEKKKQKMRLHLIYVILYT